MNVWSGKKLLLLPALLVLFLLWSTPVRATVELLDMNYDPYAEFKDATKSGVPIIQYFRLPYGGEITEFQIGNYHMNYDAWAHGAVNCESWGTDHQTTNSHYGGWFYWTLGTARTAEQNELCHFELTADSARYFDIVYDTGKELYAYAPEFCDGGNCVDQYMPFKIIGNLPATYCQDGTCNGSETCSSCQADCGVCGLDLTVYDWGYPYLWSLNSTVFQPGEQKKFIVTYDTCASYGDFDSATIFASLNGQLTGSSTYDMVGVPVVRPIHENIGAQECRGTLTYFSNTYLDNDTTASGTVKFYLKTYTATGTMITAVESNELTYNAQVSNSFIIDILNDPLFIDLGSLPYGVYTSTSTPLYFYYNFVGESPASTTVTLWDYRNATSTGYTLTGGFATSSNSSASISYPTPATSTNKMFRFIASRPGYANIMSDPFVVNWSFNPLITHDPIPFQMPVCRNPTWDISGVCSGVDTWDLLGQLTCSLRGGFGWAGVALFSPSCNSLDWIYTSYTDFKDSFPFNIFFDLTDSVDSAIISAQSSTSTAGGSFKIPFIRNTGTTSEYYMLSVMSSSSISNTIGSTNYNTFRVTLGYLWWIVVAGIVFLTIRKV